MVWDYRFYTHRLLATFPPTITTSCVIWKAFRVWLEEYRAQAIEEQGQPLRGARLEAHVDHTEKEIRGCDDLLDGMVDVIHSNLDEGIPFYGAMIFLPWMCTFPPSFDPFLELAQSHGFDQNHPIGRRVEVLCSLLEELSKRWPRETRVTEAAKVHAIALSAKYFHRSEATFAEKDKVHWQAVSDKWGRVLMRAQDAMGIAKFIRSEMDLPVHDLGAARAGWAQKSLNKARRDPVNQMHWTMHDPLALETEQLEHEILNGIGLCDSSDNELSAGSDEMTDRVFDHFYDVGIAEKERFFAFATMDFWKDEETLKERLGELFTNPVYDDRKGVGWLVLKDVGSLEKYLFSGGHMKYEEIEDLLPDEDESGVEGYDRERSVGRANDNLEDRTGDYTGHWHDLYIERLQRREQGGEDTESSGDDDNDKEVQVDVEKKHDDDMMDSIRDALRDYKGSEKAESEVTQIHQFPRREQMRGGLARRDSDNEDSE